MTSGPRFVIAPALDVFEGRCVRLNEGRRDRVTVEGGDPAAAAARFLAEGASLLHLVDLDGAFSGRPSGRLVAEVAAAAPGAALQVGGGYRNRQSIEAALTAGAARVIVGTAALEIDALRRLAAEFGERLVVAVDARDGRVVTDGWLRESELSPRDLARRCADAGVARLLTTATRRDGTLSGPDLELVAEILDVGLPVLAAGGIASLDDVRALRDLGCEGVVLGTALWLGRLTLPAVLAAVAAVTPGQATAGAWHRPWPEGPATS